MDNPQDSNHQIQRDWHRIRFYLDTIYEFVQEISKQTSIDNLLARLLRMIMGTFVVQQGIVILKDGPSGFCRLVDSVNLSSARAARISECLQEGVLQKTQYHTVTVELPDTPASSRPTSMDEIMVEVGMKRMFTFRIEDRLSVYVGLGKLPSGSDLTADQYELLLALLKHTEIALGSLLFYQSILQENEQLRETLERQNHFGGMVGQSPVMQDIYHRIRQVAVYPAYSVLISGESGTGKELIARAIHSQSPRSEHAFLAINCAALPQELVESQLFGHERGAFTGAVSARPGLFEEADKGTLFLDEIGEMSPATQAKLLRVLEQREVMRVGSNRAQPVDVRVIAATNRNLEQSIAQGRFREDLLYRFDVRIQSPSLRERKEDIPLLAEAFLEQIAKENQQPKKHLSQETYRALMSYGWPGNVRELRSLLKQAVMMTSATTIHERDIPFALAPTGALNNGQTSLNEAVEELKRNIIESALVECSGNRTQTAARLGITRQSLQKMLRRLGIE